jgi:hypothetical protein
MAHFPVATDDEGPRLTWASVAGNAGGAGFLWAEISAAAGMNCRRSRGLHDPADADFVELFAMARRLLTLAAEY